LRLFGFLFTLALSNRKYRNKSEYKWKFDGDDAGGEKKSTTFGAISRSGMILHFILLINRNITSGGQYGK